jgi:adenylyltransferase/sulfurtransferase
MSLQKMSVNERYSRQVLFREIGEAGQKRLAESRVIIIGAGALGTAQTEMLARAGVGSIRVVDRDFVEPTNLQRQTLFTEADAEARIPKAIACANHIARINSGIKVEPIVADVNGSNIERFIQGRDLVVDGTDNFATRYLINDACVKHGVYWIYGAAVGSYGVTMTIQPGRTPCLRCVFEEQPPAGSAPTCDTAGVIMPIIATVAAAQIAEALKLLSGAFGSLHGSLLQFDLWRNEWRQIRLGAPAKNCVTCGMRVFDALSAEAQEWSSVLCGRDAVQIAPPAGGSIDLKAMAERLRLVGEVKVNEYLLRLRVDGAEITLFRDARAIIRGTTDIAEARSLYARFIGS